MFPSYFALLSPTKKIEEMELLGRKSGFDLYNTLYISALYYYKLLNTKSYTSLQSYKPTETDID